MIECTAFKALCKSRSLSIVGLSLELHVSPHALGYKLNGKTHLTGKDMLDLQQIVAPEMSIEDLFPEICAEARRGLIPLDQPV